MDGAGEGDDRVVPPAPAQEEEEEEEEALLFLALLFLVVGVPVPFSDKFPQSKSYMFSKEPLLQFIDRVLDFPVVQRRRGTHSVTVQKTDLFPQVQFLGKVVAPVLCNETTVASFAGAGNPWSFHRCSSWSRRHARCYPV